MIIQTQLEIQWWHSISLVSYLEAQDVQLSFFDDIYSDYTV
jgi:hypothetical protein